MPRPGLSKMAKCEPEQPQRSPRNQSTPQGCRRQVLPRFLPKQVPYRASSSNPVYESVKLAVEMKAVLLFILALVLAASALLSPQDRSALVALSSSWPALQVVTDPWIISTADDACEAWAGVQCVDDSISGESLVTTLYVLVTIPNASSRVLTNTL